MLQRLGLGLILAMSFAQCSWADDAAFPKDGWLPKTETGALRFLDAHPTYDGRGVVVAIFDTGVDPGAAGLQVTSDGRPKIIDLVDGSGSGDVDTSVVREVSDGVLEGLTGRKLKIPAAWENPTGKYHVGWKRAYELYPRDLRNRVQRERGKRWSAQQRKLAGRLRDDLIQFDRKHPKKPLADSDQRLRDELEKRIKMLDAVQQTYQDPGPVVDCVVFHDGVHWQAAIDTNEDSDLSNEALMTNYRIKRQFATFDEDSLLNFAVNIYDDGNLLSIVADTGTHGTHVAGIVAANFPDRPEYNGLAPGAQIVSVKIGDSRLNSSSTGAGEMRGLTAVLQNGCDLINMSYGGATGDPNSGRRLARYAEIVHNQNVLFVASAGNNGPALSTVGSPGGTSSALLGIGAYVSPSLMRNAYAQRRDRPEQAYTWTSRGPTADGDLGVDICAPGGAVSPLSQWSLRRRRLGNGTSMSSPNACGNIALMLSGLKQKSVSYTPTSIRRAVVNTARLLREHDPHAHGRGLIQVDEAFDYAVSHADARNRDARFEVTFPAVHNHRGLYLRHAHQLRRPLTTTVQVSPKFPDMVGNRIRAEFDMEMRIESTVDWIDAPEVMVLTHGGKTFEIRIDASELPPGVHYGEVQGVDALSPERGPLFRAPVTVVKPHADDRLGSKSYQAVLRLKEGAEKRTFLSTPLGASWIDVEISAPQSNAGPRRYVVHALQPLPKRGYGRGFQREYVTLEPGQSIVRSYPADSSATMELCIGQYWSSLGESQLNLKARFRGLKPTPASLTLSDHLEAVRLEVLATLGDQWLAPSGELTTLRRSIPVRNIVVRPTLLARDDLPESRRVYESIATYRFSLTEDAEVAPRAAMTRTPEFSESWGSRIWQIFDENKQLVSSGTGGDTKLKKGSYVCRLHLRHDDPKQLERWSKSPLLVDITLAKPIQLKFYGDPDDALAKTRSFGERLVMDGERVVLFVAKPQTPKFAKDGDLLVGELHLGSKKRAQGGEGRRPGGYPVSCAISLRDSGPAEKQDPPLVDPEPTPFWLLARRAELAKLRERGDAKAFETLSKEILAEHSGDLPTLVERLHFLDDDNRKQRLPEIVDAADLIISKIPQSKLAAALALNVDPEDEKRLAAKQKAETKKQWLIDALYRKGRALAYMDLPVEPGTKPAEIRKHPEKASQRIRLFERNYKQLYQWVDMTEPKYVLLNIRRERRNGRQANALELLEALLKEQPTRALLYKKRRDLFRELGWDHWVEHQQVWRVIRFPIGYPAF